MACAYENLDDNHDDDETATTTRRRTIRTNGKERTKKHIHMFARLYAHTSTYTHTHATRSCHEFWMSKRLCRPSRRCTNYEWTSEWIQPVPTTPPPFCLRPSGALLSSFFCPFRPYETLRLALVVLYISFAPPFTDPAVAQRSTGIRATPRISRISRREIAWLYLVRTFQRCSVSECVITGLLRFYCGANVKSLARVRNT